MRISVQRKALFKLYNGSIRHIASYTLANFLSKGISFILLPVFTYYISEKGFGILALINNSILLLNAFILFSVPITLSTEYVKRDKETYKSLFTSLFGYVVISTFFSALLIGLFFNKLESNFGFQQYYIILLPVLTFFNFFSEQINNFLRLENKSATFFKINVAKTIIEVGIAFLLLFLLNNDYYSRVISMSVTSLLVTLFGIYYFFFQMQLFGKFNFRFILNELPFGLSILIWQVGIFLMCSSDKFFINYFYGNEITGIYNIASILAGILFIVSSSAMSYFAPEIYKILSEGNNIDVLLRRQFKNYLILVLSASVIVFFFGTAAYLWFIKKTYLIGYSAFCILIIGNVFWALGGYFHPIIWYYRAKTNLVIIAAISILISIPIYYSLTKYYSMLGTALSLLIICSLISTLIGYCGIRLLRNSTYKIHA